MGPKNCTHLQSMYSYRIWNNSCSQLKEFNLEPEYKTDQIHKNVFKMLKPSREKFQSLCKNKSTEKVFSRYFGTVRAGTVPGTPSRAKNV